jgi:hypothetical protein
MVVKRFRIVDRFKVLSSHQWSLRHFARDRECNLGDRFYLRLARARMMFVSTSVGFPESRNDARAEPPKKCGRTMVHCAIAITL